MSDVSLLILTTGETVIGEVVADVESSITLKNPITFAPTPDGRGVVTIPYLQFSKEKEVTFWAKDIRHRLTPNDDLKSQYCQQFGLIDVPDKNIII